MARDDLSEELIEAGQNLLSATDDMGMSAQGAMWVYSYALQDWRYYLVTSLVDNPGRRKTYQLLIRAFESGKFPDGLTVEDVHLGSPSEDFFQLVSSVVGVDGGIARFTNCSFNNVAFDGVIYRSVRSVPSKPEAKRIEATFERRVKQAASAA